MRGEDGTIRGTVKVKGTLNRSSKGWYIGFPKRDKKGELRPAYTQSLFPSKESVLATILTSWTTLMLTIFPF